MKIKFKDLGIKVFLLGFSLLLSFLVLEGIFRIFQIQHHTPKSGTWSSAILPKAERLPEVRIQFRPHTKWSVTYGTNPDDYFDENNQLHYRMNNYGFRGRNYNMQKSAGTRRVIVLGDSFTLGDGVKLEDTYCLKLQERLRKVIPQVEVLNFGTSGWNTVDEINYLRMMGVQFNPDLVIVSFVLNDAAVEFWPGDLYRDEFEEAYENRIFIHSYVLNYFHVLLTRYRLSGSYIEHLTASLETEKKIWDRTLNRLVKGKQLAEAVGSKYMVFIFPFFYELNNEYPFQELHRLVRMHCEKNQIPVLDLFGSFEGQNHLDLWVHPTDQHPNAEAHEITAEALASFVIDKRLLQD